MMNEKFTYPSMDLISLSPGDFENEVAKVVNGFRFSRSGNNSSDSEEIARLLLNGSAYDSAYFNKVKGRVLSCLKRMPMGEGSIVTEEMIKDSSEVEKREFQRTQGGEGGSVSLNGCGEQYK